ncbi:DinB family protein [uncultured Paludibaculum sp.]|uniref:DinB family protein n=1 Tax=uncultured Paludibaculum sp. TaxID=1765020 RepID=UPI002AABF18C|nr:DinB family protein [uncultured Paludibaculum sp.]
MAASAFGQKTDNPLSTSTKGLYTMAKGNLVKAAEKMPEEQYDFKPTPDVRSFGQVVGHVADANFMFCSAAIGEKPPVSGIEKGKTTKADLVQGLKDSFAYCDKAYDGMTDARGAATVKFFGSERPALNVLNFNIVHDYEHYGNIVTYLRLKGLVPPSSEGR